MEKRIPELEVWLSLAQERGVTAKIARLLDTDVPPKGSPREIFAQDEDLLYPASVHKAGGDVLALLKLKLDTALGVFGKNRNGFKGIRRDSNGMPVQFCALNHANAEELRKALPFTAPSPLSGMDVTIGVGDRLGVASPGHIRLFQSLNEKTLKVKGIKIAPVFAQQSVREITLTDRVYEDVLDSASWAVFQEGFEEPWGADGDHLKTVDWVKKALKIGFTMITADVSDYIRGEFASLEEREILAIYEKRTDKSERARLEGRYLNLFLELDTGDVIRLSRADLARATLVYSEALEHALAIYQVGMRTGKVFDFELSIDETETPTLPQAHVFIANEMKERDVRISSLAPRFVGEFQKGIDYIGDKREFESTFKIHAAIAREFGYRLSVHSGSDKFTVFPAVGKYTNYRFHLKTAGTNWLQALLVIAETEPAFFRKLYGAALKVFPEARKYYHITPNLENLPDLAALLDSQLPVVFENIDARQVLHVTYGELFKDKELKKQFFSILARRMERYWESLYQHIGKHFKYLGLTK
ncbi:MAG TPA: tagaturonate epimerase family protein [Spirochaetia bacterium]|nr:tagaturonate epimerase family protein [Spirochaetia bacterium]